MSDWPHAPPHRLAETGVYMVTSRARQGKSLFFTPQRRDWFQDLLLNLANEFDWKLEAWAVLSNHYHLVAHSPEGETGANSLRPLIRKVHSLATKQCNVWDQTPGRTRLWHNFRETHLTYEASYFARLHYVHENAVHHGLVTHGWQWRWCSASAFEAAERAARVATVKSFRYDQIAKDDGE